MGLGWLRLGLLAAALVLPAALMHAALPGGQEDTSAKTSLVGQFLIATPDMGDPRFERTVILIAEHDQTGALGIVLNRPIGDETMKDLLEAVGEKDPDAAGAVRVFAGGPVQPETGFVVHTPDYRLPETHAITDRLSLTSNVKILRDVAGGKGPAKILVAFGYAGWGPGQLENEIEAGAWATGEADPTLVFDADRDKLWEEAWSRRTQRL